MSEESNEKCVKCERPMFGYSNEYVETNGLLFKSTRPKQGGAFLSNFWGPLGGVSENAKASAIKTYNVDPTEGGVVVDDTTFVSIEHYFQWRKAGFIDEEYQKLYVDGRSGGDFKKMGGKGAYVKWRNKLAPKGSDNYMTQVAAKKHFETRVPLFWKESKDIMREAIRHKFSDQNPSLVNGLVETYPLLLGETHGRGGTPWDVVGVRGIGFNWLGELLMERREQLMENM